MGEQIVSHKESQEPEQKQWAMVIAVLLFVLPFLWGLIAGQAERSQDESVDRVE